jgi:hypothetical protein
MKARVLMLLVLVLLWINPVQGQQLRLVRPSLQAYLQAFPRLLTAMRPFPEAHLLLEAELKVNYPELAQADYALVNQTYQFLRDQNPEESLDEGYWLGVRVASWLKTQEINLDAPNAFQFEGQTVPVRAVDFNGDGRNEWILDLQTNPTQGLLVLQQSGTSYRVLATPLPFTTLRFSGADPITSYEVLHSGDLTGDNLPEVAVLVQERDTEYAAIYGKLFILSWQGEGLWDIGSSSLGFFLPSLQTQWDFVNLDSDSALEIRQVRQMRDNWGCAWEQTTHFDWDGYGYIESAIEDNFPSTSGCFLRRAESALWAGDYETAITLYQQVDSRHQYARIRLALAYALSDKTQKTVELLQTILSTPASTDRLTELAKTLLEAYEVRQNTLDLCLAAYNFFTFNPHYLWLKQGLEVGHTEDNAIVDSGVYSPTPADPARAGCDAPAYVDNLLAANTFWSDRPPVQQLERLGLQAHDVLLDDWNEDTIQDALVWLDAVNIPPIFMLSDDKYFYASRPYIADGYPLNELNHILRVTTPNGKGLLSVNFASQSESLTDPGSCPEPGALNLWNFTGDTLAPTFSTTLCKRIAPQATVDDVNAVSKIYGWAYSRVSENFVPIEYVWDLSYLTYALPPEVEASLTPAQDFVYIPSFMRQNGPALFVAGDYQTIVDARDEAYYNQYPQEDLAFIGWRYLTALAWEASGQTEDALTEFVTVQQLAPESAWGILAALHLETITP